MFMAGNVSRAGSEELEGEHLLESSHNERLHVLSTVACGDAPEASSPPPPGLEVRTQEEGECNSSQAHRLQVLRGSPSSIVEGTKRGLKTAASNVMHRMTYLTRQGWTKVVRFLWHLLSILALTMVLGGDRGSRGKTAKAFDYLNSGQVAFRECACEDIATDVFYKGVCPCSSWLG